MIFLLKLILIIYKMDANEETDFKFIIVGNKNDKINERIIRFDSLFVTKTKYNVDNIFLAITEEIVKI